MKTIDDAAKFMRSTGLLTEINRVVLHPRGLALSVIQEDDGSVSRFGPLLDVRDDPEGMIFGEDDLSESVENLRRAQEDGRCPVLPSRLSRLGYVIQPVKR
jgi:hypothetical protein